MLASLIRRFTAPEDDSALPPDDARLALAALMVRVARADEAYDAVEWDAMEAALTARYDLTAEAAGALRTEAEAAERAAPDTVRFTRLIKQAVPHMDRISVVEDLWRIALADDHRDPHEEAVIRQVIGLIGVSDRDSALARRRIGDHS